MDQSIVNFIQGFIVEIFGIIITVVIVDRLLKKRVKQREKPLRRVLQSEIVLNTYKLKEAVKELEQEKKKKDLSEIADFIQKSEKSLEKYVDLGIQIIPPKITQSILKINEKLDFLTGLIPERNEVVDEKWHELCTEVFNKILELWVALIHWFEEDGLTIIFHREDLETSEKSKLVFPPEYQ